MHDVVVRDDNRIPDLVRELRALATNEVTAGLHAELVPTQTMIAATVNEFGAEIPKTPKMRRYLAAMARKHGIVLDSSKGRPDVIVIPPRSFVRSTASERREEIMAIVMTMVDKVLAGEATAMDALNAVGLKMEQLIKDQINRVTEPPLHPLTVAMKGSHKPLVRTGTMRKAVTYRIRQRSGGA